MATTLDWYGCATFSLRTAGLTIFLDAYIDRPAGAQGTGLTASDITEADYVLVGHSHFDHLWGAERIIANTDATLIASYESVRVMEQAGVPLDRMICVAGGETIELSPDVKVSVYPSQHSCVWSHAQMEEPDVVCIGDLGVTWQEQQSRMADLMSYLMTDTTSAVRSHLVDSSPGHSDRGDGGALRPTRVLPQPRHERDDVDETGIFSVDARRTRLERRRGWKRRGEKGRQGKRTRGRGE